ncbi:(2Fe-2S)-binding protein [Planctomycetes bacterium K23_9]|uniref:Nitrite reductase [NAD(P)H] n=1 Tax=Stieleria marina TaxID=1930275 RepID=A0A517NRX9_9BACT|nr:Nitrite reductase [NAD(P)H] [Planctomycetes bacterium K23_9]
MNDDDHVCLCFHVTRHKVMQFIRAERPKKASQLSECYGAGTGCGWCRPFLEKMMQESDPAEAELPEASVYAKERATYRQK